MTATITPFPRPIDAVIMGPTPPETVTLGNMTRRYPRDEMDALLAEPTPEYGPADLMTDWRMK